MRARLWWAASLMAALSSLSAPCWAEDPSSLAEVERAYGEVDFEKTRSLARAAVERGGNERATTVRLYLLWATSAAALDQAEEARDAFLRVLAAEPAVRLDKSLSPKIRAPYLEARGMLAADQGRPPLEVTLQRRGTQLELGLRDTLHVAHAVTLATRTQLTESFNQRRFEARALRRLPLPPGSELEFFTQVLDQHQNVLVEQGAQDDPRRLTLARSTRAPTPDLPSGSDANPTPYYATASVLAVLGAASGVGAAVMYSRREDAAREWNGPSCELPGATRRELCGDVDDRRQRAEYLSIGLSAAGGTLLVGSLVSLLLAPARHARQASITVEAAPQTMTLRLNTPL